MSKPFKSDIIIEGNISVTDEAYGISWNGSTDVPTKNALYDKIETIATPDLQTVLLAGGTNGHAENSGPNENTYIDIDIQDVGDNIIEFDFEKLPTVGYTDFLIWAAGLHLEHHSTPANQECHFDMSSGIITLLQHGVGGTPTNTFQFVTPTGSNKTLSIPNPAATSTLVASISDGGSPIYANATTGDVDISSLLGGTTNLGTTHNATDVIITSDTGTDATINLANGTTAGISENNLTDAEKTILGNTSGTNSGDQTSIVGITGTVAQFNTALTDGNFITFQIKSVAVETPSSSEDISLFFTDVAITITKMVAVVRGTTPSVTWTIRHSTDRSAVGNEVVTSGTTTTSQTTGSVVTAFNDATIPADSFVWLETTAMSGTVDELSMNIKYTED